MLNLDRIDDSFKAFFEMEEVKDEIKKINKFLINEEAQGYEITPNKENILRFARVPLKQYEIIVIGQDPYPARGRATGRAFEVNDLNKFTDKFSQQSIKNIVTAINMKITNNTYRKYDFIKEDIITEKFNIQYPKLYFSALEEQGIIFLNTAFTCRVGKPGSHMKIWSNFTKLLLQYISKTVEPTWILWGGKAQELDIYMKGKKITNYHPSYKDRIANKYPFFDKPFELLDKDWTGLIYEVQNKESYDFNINIKNRYNDLDIFIDKKLKETLSSLKDGDRCLTKLKGDKNYFVTLEILNNEIIVSRIKEED